MSKKFVSRILMFPVTKITKLIVRYRLKIAKLRNGLNNLHLAS
jgi:hypothetical protein